MANRRGSFGPRMDKEWNALPGQKMDISTGTVLGPALEPNTSATVLRMIGEYVLAAQAGGTFVAGDAVNIGVGIGVISSDAFAAGAGSVPDPSGEPEYPWLYWKKVPVFFRSAGVEDLASNAVTSRHAFDIKSMRKMKPRESLVFIIDYGNLSGDPPMTLTFGGARVLLGGI